MSRRPESRRRTATAVAAALLFLAALTGCGQDNGGKAGGTADSPVTTGPGTTGPAEVTDMKSLVDAAESAAAAAESAAAEDGQD
ncbi:MULTISPECIES: hypothetical protein [unclassified Streptomyces]|uniref:hypothetical protein n=1 Tax=unclassified Streptomyces TaxID=2593676 RepID=UPI002DDBF30F|nr:hypothetical protein [Streptomyces sp. NBC_01750]WSB01498.1 hypothetical protein OIE54_20630 [Streptomyces sp. NBC_01794]WSD34174.1 hypothetical protein OG966_21145 [Streptomyces sp. NBC_01750]